MQLEPGAVAPDFSATDLFGRPLHLADLRGRSLLLAFMRYASCPLCNLRVRELVLAHEALSSQGLAIWVVFQSGAASLREHVGRHDAPFPLIADPSMSLYRRYGVERSWRGLLAPTNLREALRAIRLGFRPGRVDGPVERMPADFLIDPQGRIARAFYAARAGEHLPLEEVSGWLADARAKKSPAAAGLEG